ncbi:hypothetical protein C5U62_20945 [Pseudomonas protegens]|uniref:Uncharacterized protein n=1 Tax=Pseudomonas protegens TaxID=380021 RepID=A0A2T6GG34_9PSED|nr:hypothetical protein C5U62_20945 [Pseudomonas protegens]
MSRTITPLEDALAELAALADTDDEGLRQAIQDTMDGIKSEFEVKADSIVMLRRNIEGFTSNLASTGKKP